MTGRIRDAVQIEKGSNGEMGRFGTLRGQIGLLRRVGMKKRTIKIGKEQAVDMLS